MKRIGVSWYEEEYTKMEKQLSRAIAQWRLGPTYGKQKKEEMEQESVKCVEIPKAFSTGRKLLGNRRHQKKVQCRKLLRMLWRRTEEEKVGKIFEGSF